MSSYALLLISHAHTPPLSPPGDLKYDLRSLANPPKPARDAYDGTAKRLREWLKADSSFRSLVEKAAGQIEAKMREIEAASRSKDSTEASNSTGEALPQSPVPEVNTPAVHEDSEDSIESSDSEEEASSCVRARTSPTTKTSVEPGWSPDERAIPGDSGTFELHSVRRPFARISALQPRPSHQY